MSSKSALVMISIGLSCISFDSKAWDPWGDITHPERIINNGVRETGNAVRDVGNAVGSVIPTNPTCLQWSGNPIYHQTMFVINNNRSELSHYGVVDRNSCQARRDVVVGIASKYNVPLAAVSWDLGRCACDSAY